MRCRARPRRSTGGATHTSSTRSAPRARRARRAAPRAAPTSPPRSIGQRTIESRGEQLAPVRQARAAAGDADLAHAAALLHQHIQAVGEGERHALEHRQRSNPQRWCPRRCRRRRRAHADHCAACARPTSTAGRTAHAGSIPGLRRRPPSAADRSRRRAARPNRAALAALSITDIWCQRSGRQ